MKKNKAVMLVDSKLYSLEAIYGASYVFLDRAYIFLESGPGTKIKITLKSKEGILKNLENEFYNELINFGLRETISKNNRKIREYIVGRALSSALGDHSPAPKILPEQRGPFWKKDDSGTAIPWNNEVTSNNICEISQSDSCDSAGDFIVPWNREELALSKKDNINNISLESGKLGEGDWEKDPLGIAIPWEGKQSNKKSDIKKNTKISVKKVRNK